MMRSRVLSFLVAFLIIIVAFSVAFMNPVSADDPEDWEPDNDKSIYLRPGEPGETEFYNYNYTDVALEEDVELEEGIDGINEFSYDSEISLDANVRSVKPCPDVNNIRIAVSAPGAYRWNESESIYNPNDSDKYTPPFGHVGTLGTAIEAEITGMEGYEDKTNITPSLLIHPEYNSADNFTDGDGDAGCPDTDPDEWQELAVEGGILAAEIGLAAMNVKTLGALSATHYALKLASTYAETDPIDPLPEHEISDSGEDASVSQSWEHDRPHRAEREYHLFNLDYWEYEEHLEEGPVDQELVEAFDEKGHEIADWSDLEEEDDDVWSLVNENGGFFTLERDEDKLKIYGEDIPLERAHTASTMIYFELPTDDLPDEATLEISAKNVLGTADEEGEITEAADGAEATVEIPIKNAEPEIEEEMDTDKNSYEASDYSSSVYPHLEGLTVENPAGCTDVDYEVEIEWDGEWDYDTHTAYTWITHEEEIDKTLNIAGIPEDGEWHEVEIMYSIKAHDRYGGWERILIRLKSR